MSRRPSRGGLKKIRTHQSNGLTAYSVFPTFTLSGSTVKPLAHGLITLTGTVGSNPVLDPLSATVDPRFAFTLGANWVRDAWGLSATLSNSLSLGGAVNSGQTDSISGALTASYRISEAVLIDAGVRGTRQSFQEEEVIPPSYAGFIGLTLAFDTAR